MIQNENLPKKLPYLVYEISLEEELKAIGPVQQAMEKKLFYNFKQYSLLI